MYVFVCVYIVIAYLPVASRQVLEGTGSTLQSCRIRALCQQCQVRLNH